jgi:polar amino acid transport system substrate-binding protein
MPKSRLINSSLTKWIAAGAILLSLQGAAFAGEVLDRIKAAGVIRVATDPAWPPYSWKTADGQWQGFDASVAEEIAKRLGVKVEFVTPSWDVITSGDWQGKWDLSVGSMSPTEDRAKVLDFPAVYYYSPTVLAVNKANKDILTPADASGKRVGALKGSIFEKYLRRQPLGMADEIPPVYKISDAVIVTFETSEAASKDLAKGGGIDAMVDDMMYFLFLIKDGAPIRIVGQPLSYGPNAIAIEPGDKELTTLLSDTIGAMHDDGTLTALSNKWFGVDLTHKF